MAKRKTGSERRRRTYVHALRDVRALAEEHRCNCGMVIGQVVDVYAIDALINEKAAGLSTGDEPKTTEGPGDET